MKMDDAGTLPSAAITVPASPLLEAATAGAPLGPHALRLSCEADIRLTPAQAEQVHVVIREALANALAHAFPEERRGTVWLSLRREKGRLRLRIGDDGIGIPDIDLEVMPGLARIARASEALGGYARMGSASRTGGEVVLVFPEAV